MASSQTPMSRYHDLEVSYSSSSNSGSSGTGKATVHYVEAGDPSSPKLLLLHGFPSSSNQYRNLIPLFSSSYHVLAPDYPGFGFTKVEDSSFSYTFENLTIVIAAWLKALNISKTAVYIQDYGSPVGLRLALHHSISYSAIITQNGNFYEAGFGQDFWAPIFNLWKTKNSAEARKTIADGVLNLGVTQFQYTAGVPESDLPLIDPLVWHFDYLNNLKGKEDLQLDLFYDYRTNVDLYPKIHEYLRESKVPVLAVWGKGDPAFIPAGAEAIKADVPHVKVHLLDAGHFATETKGPEIARIAKEFLSEVGW